MGIDMDPSFIQPTEHRPASSIKSGAGNDEIPVIDLSGEDRAELARAIGGACEEWGFFQVINHGVDKGKRERLESKARDFFSMSAVEKRRAMRNESNPMGYDDSELTNNVRDWKENFDFNALDPVLIPADPNPGLDLDPVLIELCSQWPHSPPDFREACEEYAAEMVKLSYKLLGLIETSLGLPQNRLLGFFEHQISFTRLNYYRPCPFPDLALGVGPHKDSCALTILAQDDVSGLQVRRKSDGEWILIEPTPDAFIINVGDVLEVWSNDKYDSVEHRVKANREKGRLSIPFFFEPSHYVEVKPLDELVDEDNPPKYKGYNYGKLYSSMRLSGFIKP